MPNKMVKLVLAIFLASVMILGFGGLCAKKDKDKGIAIGSSGALLAFVQEPTTTTAGANISPAVTVRVRSQFGTIVPNTAVSVTTTTQLNGTTTQLTDANGIATFDNLNITTTGTCVLAARAGALGPINSTNFDITAAIPNTLTFVQQPTITVAGGTISPAVTVRVRDQYNNLAPNVAVSVTTTTQLNGTTTQTTDASGIATFDNLNITTTGTYQLAARSGVAGPVNSGSFTITLTAPNTLIFVQQPVSTIAGATIAPAVTVRITDQYGNLVPSVAVSVTTTTQLNGTTTQLTDASGIATFNNLNITTTGTYLLAARAGALGPINSTNFDITPAAANKLLWVANPGTSQTAGTNWAVLSIEVTDAYGNRRTSDNATSVSVVTVTGTSDFSTGKTATVSSGLATFSTVTYNKAEAITIKGSAAGLTATATSASITVSPALLDHYSITVTNTAIVSGTGYTETNAISARDAYENLRSSDITIVTATITAASGAPTATFYTSATYTITTTTYTLSAGVATIYYRGFHDGTAGDTFRIKATDAALKTGESQIITVN